MIVLLIMSVAWKMSKGDAIPPNAGLNAVSCVKLQRKNTDDDHLVLDGAN